MKLLSIILRIIAVAGAAFCVYTWLDTKGKTSESMEHMKGFQGETLQAKTAQVPEFLKSKEKVESELKLTSQKLKSTQGELEDSNTSLKAERQRVVQANSDAVKKNAEIKSLKSKVEKHLASIKSKDSEVEVLKKEIVKIKNASEPIISDLKSEISKLEVAIATKDKEIAEAVKKAEKEALAKLEEVVSVDPTTGEKTVKKVVKEEPYKATGDIAAVLKVDNNNSLFVINKGTENNLKLNQNLILKNEGKLVADVMVLEVSGNMAVCSILDKDTGIPETIEVNDLYELCVPAVAESEETKQ